MDSPWSKHESPALFEVCANGMLNALKSGTKHREFEWMFSRDNSLLKNDYNKGRFGIFIKKKNLRISGEGILFLYFKKKISSKFFPFIRVMGWIVSPRLPRQKIMLKFNPPMPENVTMFGNKVFTKVIKLIRALSWALIQYDWRS